MRKKFLQNKNNKKSNKNSYLQKYDEIKKRLLNIPIPPKEHGMLVQ